MLSSVVWCSGVLCCVMLFVAPRCGVVLDRNVYACGLPGWGVCWFGMCCSCSGWSSYSTGVMFGSCMLGITCGSIVVMSTMWFWFFVWGGNVVGFAYGVVVSGSRVFLSVWLGVVGVVCLVGVTVV